MIKTALKFGLFTIVCLGFATYLAFVIGNISFRDPLARDYYELSAEFSDVTGLLVADNVKVAGVAVGKVTSIKVDEGRAVVRFKVRNDVRLPADSEASVRWRNLIGQRFLYLHPGTASSTVLTAGDHLPLARTKGVIDLGQLFNELGPIVASLDSEEINVFLDTIGQALDGNQDKIGRSLDDLATIATALGDRDVQIGRLVENLNVVAGTVADRDQQIRVMLDNLVTLSGTLSANTGTIDAALEEFGRFSTNLSTLVSGNTSEIGRLLENLATLASETVTPNLVHVDEILGTLETSVRRVFAAGSYGEWLNQKIHCLGVGPPGALPFEGLSSNNCAGLGTLPLPLPGIGTRGDPLLGGLTGLLGGTGTTTGSAAPAGTAGPAPAAATAGAGASSFQAGVDALLGLLAAPLGGGAR